MNTLLVCIGGAIGAVLRYLVGLSLMKKFPHPTIPVAMLVVNVIGSFGLGLFFGLAYKEIPVGPSNDPLYLLIGIGFFGAFTTFSTFSIETIQLIKSSQWKKGSVYLVLSIFASIVMFLIGVAIGIHLI